MPRRRNEETAAAARAPRHTRPASPSALPACQPPAFQLAVVNSCLRNEDIRLPQRPTPALLARFYHACDPATAAAPAAGASTSSPWGTEYWRTRVPHVPLGRHSALPAAYQLRHACVGRLQARVVYIHAPGVHRQLRRAYPVMDVTRATDSEQCGLMTVEEVPDDDDVVVVRVEPPAASRASTVSPLPPFTTPYYLLINHGANPVFVGVDTVPQGRSVVLRDGDVVSFLECAFDEDGGVLDDAAAGSGRTHHPSPDDDAAEPGSTAAASLAESVMQLANASLMQCVGRETSVVPAALTDVRVSHGLVGTRRLYEVPHMIRDYMRWWQQQQHQHQQATSAPTSAVDGSSPRPAPPSTASAATAWMVAGNRLVRAPSIATGDVARGTAAASSSPPPPPSAPATPARDASRKRSRSPPSPPLQPTVVAALRHWLTATEELEEVAEQAPSPLAAQLRLDRAWLWHLVRRHRQASTTPALAVAAKASASPPLIKTEMKEEETAADGVPLVAVKQQGEGPADRTAECFRVSLRPSTEDHGDGDSDHGDGDSDHGVTPTRAASVVRSVLEELRRSRSGALTSPPAPPAGHTAEAGTGSAVRRRLCLDVDPIDVYAEAGAPGPLSDSTRGSPPRLASPPRAPADVAATSGVRTCVTGVWVRPAALPVYVFTARRGHSPDVHTRDRATLALTSPASPTSAATGAAKQFVYYYEETEETDGGRGRRRQPHAPVDDAAVAAALLWVDETEETSGAVASGRQQQQRRRPHRKTAGATHGKGRTAPPPATAAVATAAGPTKAEVPLRRGRPRKNAPK